MMDNEKELDKEISQEEPAANIEATVPEQQTAIMTIGSADPVPGHNTTIHSVSLAIAQEAPVKKLVRVRIKYPDNWKKEKFLKDGDIKEVAPETAQEFVRLKIGTIVQDNEA